MVLTPALAFIRYPQIDPVLVHIGPLMIRWYGLAYVAGFVLAYVALARMVHAGRLKTTTDNLNDLISWLIVAVVVGGRTGWWLVYHRAGPTPEPWWEPVAFWHGGMSFHGALLAVSLALVLWARRRRVPLWNLVDAAALVAPIGLFLGRIANFINTELYGRPTSLPWGVLFPGETVPRHPSEIYEALLEGPALFLVVWGAGRVFRLREGQRAAVFVTAYGVFRFLVEFTREPDEQIGFIAGGWLTMGQLLSVVLVVAGVVIWFLASRILLVQSGSVDEPVAVSERQPERRRVSNGNQRRRS